MSTRDEGRTVWECHGEFFDGPPPRHGTGTGDGNGNEIECGPPRKLGPLIRADPSGEVGEEDVATVARAMRDMVLEDRGLGPRDAPPPTVARFKVPARNLLARLRRTPEESEREAIEDILQDFAGSRESYDSAIDRILALRSTEEA